MTDRIFDSKTLRLAGRVPYGLGDDMLGIYSAYVDAGGEDGFADWFGREGNIFVPFLYLFSEKRGMELDYAGWNAELDGCRCPLSGGSVTMQFDDGWTWNEIAEERDLLLDGLSLRIWLMSGRIFVLRNSEGITQAVICFDRANRVVLMRGPGMAPIAAEHRKYVEDFFRKMRVTLYDLRAMVADPAWTSELQEASGHEFPDIMLVPSFNEFVYLERPKRENSVA